MIQKMLFKDISIFSAGGHFNQWSGTVWEIFVDDIMSNIYVKLL